MSAGDALLVNLPPHRPHRPLRRRGGAGPLGQRAGRGAGSAPQFAPPASVVRGSCGRGEPRGEEGRRGRRAGAARLTLSSYTAPGAVATVASSEGNDEKVSVYSRTTREFRSCCRIRAAAVCDIY